MVPRLAPDSIFDPFSFDAIRAYAGCGRPLDEHVTDQLEADAQRAALESDAAHLDFDAQLDARRALIALGDRLGRDTWELVVASAAAQLGYCVSFA